MTEQTKMHPNIGGRIFINPGSGPVGGASFLMALDNINQFCKDLGSEYKCAVGVDAEWTDDGRYQFSVWKEGEENDAKLVDMPGIPLEEIRYMREEDQNIWDYPRLYVDGSSWVWFFALKEFKEEEVL